MNKKEFEELIQRIKAKNPRIFGLESDCTAKVEDIEMMEKYYNIVFPESYKDFLLQYGGGYFAFTIVYSFDKQSCFYVKNNVSVQFVKDNKIFPIIDFETGDLAGFKVDNGRCEDTIVLYDHEEKIISDTELNFYDALGKYGLNIHIS